MQDLWPEDIAQVSNKAPVTILKEQASLLGQRTKNIVTAEVRQLEQSSEYEIVGEIRSGELGNRPHYDFNYRFYIVAPALQDYHFKLFDLSHNVELYPAVFKLDSEIANELQVPLYSALTAGIAPTPFSVASESELLSELRNIFAARKTLRVIASLLGQSTGDVV